MPSRLSRNQAQKAPLISPSRSCPNSACGGIPSSSNIILHPWDAIRSTLLDERAGALAERPKGLGGRDGGELLVVVVLIFRLAGRLDLEEVHVALDTPILAQFAVLGHEVVDRQLAHLGDDGLAVVGLRRLDRLEVMGDSAIDAGLDHR